MSEGRRKAGVAVVAWTMSLLAHFALLATVGPSLSRRFGSSPLPARAGFEIDIDASEPTPSEGPGQAAAAPCRGEECAKTPVATTPVQGGDRTPRPDIGRKGRGGTDDSAAPAVNLAPRDDQVLRSPSLMSRLDRSQAPRRRSADRRSSPEDDDAAMRPMILTFVADGPGAREEQRPRALRDPSAGAWRSPPAARAGLEPQLDEADAERRVFARNQRDGAAAPAAGAGITAGAPGSADRASADTAQGRPLVLPGSESSRSTERDGQRDSVDSEQEIHTRTRSLLNASPAGGEAGEGRGGQRGPGATGSGGTVGPGSSASALGDGRGPGAGVDSADARRNRYVRAIWHKIQNNWSASDFPKAAALEGKQGYTIVTFVVNADGSVASARITRPSGIDSFDRKMRAAVIGAAPFGPLPAELGPRLTQSHEFIVSNPAVRPAAAQ
jgi:TonB family protein